MITLRKLLKLKQKPNKPKIVEFISVADANQSFKIFLKRNKRAKRMTLRQNIADGSFSLTMPQRGNLSHAKAFCESHIKWISTQANLQDDVKILKNGQIIPLRGQDYKLVFIDKLRGVITQTDHEIIVTGGDDFAPKRLAKWLKAEAKTDIQKAIDKYEPLLNVKHSKLAVRDTTTRWGSCSTNKSISFSWRLILAPSDILDYVVAHELAHILEMNHSSKFWHHVEAVCDHTQQSRDWLKLNGGKLHKIRIK